MDNAMDAHLILVKEKFGEESSQVKDLTNEYIKLKKAQGKKVESYSSEKVKSSSSSSSSNKVTSQIGTKPLQDILREVTSTPQVKRPAFIPQFFARGTNYVPSTGLYTLHKGEAVIPSNRASEGESYQININVTGNTITKDTLADVAKEVGRAVDKSLIDKKTGKSKYRLR
jgi:hypothetical protein